MKTQVTFKQVDVERAIKAARKAGLVISAVEITRDGTIRILTSAEGTASAPDEDFEF